MTEVINYLKIAKKNADHADKPGSENVDSAALIAIAAALIAIAAALIAIAAALIAKIEDDREWRQLIIAEWNIESFNRRRDEHILGDL